MKLLKALATPTLLALGSHAFLTGLYGRFQPQAPIWLRLPARSKLPLFVHDFNHPWIKQNTTWLEQRPDPTSDLCVAGSALGNRKIEGHAVPTDLFHNLEIVNQRTGTDRAGWINLRDRLNEISKCPAALQQVTYLHIDVYVGKEGLMNPGEEIIQLLADVLSKMPNLKKLHWGFPSDANTYLDKVFAQRGLRLPSITHLIVGAYSQYMVSICPNLEKLEGGSYSHHWSWNDVPYDREDSPAMVLLQEASRAPTIVSLSFTKTREEWNTQIVRGKTTRES